MIERDEETYPIIGAAMTVHREFGSGFLEAVYQEALERELDCKQSVFRRSHVNSSINSQAFFENLMRFSIQCVKIPFERGRELPIVYRGVPVKAYYKADFVCFSSVIVGLKALQQITDIEESQVIPQAVGFSIGSNGFKHEFRKLFSKIG